MSEQTMTMGEAVDRHGPCVVFVAIADLAQAVKRIPIGEWAYGPFQTDPRYSLWVNGGTSEHWQPEGCVALIGRFYAYVEFNGWPAALVCPAGGSVTMDEGQLIDALKSEAQRHVGETPMTRENEKHADRLELMIRCLNIPLADDVAAMEAGAASLRAAQTGWRDISTAPKDGTHITVITMTGWREGHPDPLPTTVHWWAGEGHQDWQLSVNQHGEYSTYVWGPPTHWMPLPSPPSRDPV